jgi:hypothetical protein
MRMRRFSSMQNHNERRVTRGALIAEQPVLEDAGERKIEDGIALAASMSPAMRPSFNVGRTSTSRIAEMWVDERERKRRLTYSEDV